MLPYRFECFTEQLLKKGPEHLALNSEMMRVHHKCYSTLCFFYHSFALYDKKIDPFNGFLATGMKLLVDRFESFLVNMGVNLGCGDVGMAEHNLYRTKIGAMCKEVGGKRMAEAMW